MTSSCIRNKNTFLQLCQLIVGIILVYLVLFSTLDLHIPLQPRRNNIELQGNVNTAIPDRRVEDYGVWWRILLCGEGARQLPEDTEDSIVLQQLSRDIEPAVSDSNVFLVETTCDSNPLYRSWCSVESWAHQNPSLKVWYVLTSVTADSTDGLHRHLLQRYPNLQIVGAQLENMFAKTPAKDFFMSGNWTQNKEWVPVVMSEMLRTVVVWHWGGFYSDTDIMCLRSMRNFSNAIGIEVGRVVNSAFYTMDDHSPFLRLLLEKMSIHYSPKWWASLGVAAYSQMMKKECEKNNVKIDKQKPPITCGNITIYPREHFFPLLYDKIPQFFADGTGKDYSKVFNGSSLFHVWNKLSSMNFAKAKSGSLYEEVAKKFCPITYKYAVRRSKLL